MGNGSSLCPPTFVLFFCWCFLWPPPVIPNPDKSMAYPHWGQPDLNWEGSPSIPQWGQRTEAKKWPQREQTLSSRPTSELQFSQKNRAVCFFIAPPIPCRRNKNLRIYGKMRKHHLRRIQTLEKRFQFHRLTHGGFAVRIQDRFSMVHPSFFAPLQNDGYRHHIHIHTLAYSPQFFKHKIKPNQFLYSAIIDVYRVFVYYENNKPPWSPSAAATWM